MSVFARRDISPNMQICKRLQWAVRVRALRSQAHHSLAPIVVWTPETPICVKFTGVRVPVYREVHFSQSDCIHILSPLPVPNTSEGRRCWHCGKRIGTAGSWQSNVDVVRVWAKWNRRRSFCLWWRSCCWRLGRGRFSCNRHCNFRLRNRSRRRCTFRFSNN